MTTPLRILAGLAALAVAACAPDTASVYGRLTDYYAATGKLRTDLAPSDAPFSSEDLVRNFARIAFRNEFSRDSDGVLVAAEAPSTLLKWDGPINWKLSGDAATEADRAEYIRLIARISAATGLAFRETRGEADILVTILSWPARRQLIAYSRAVGDGPSADILETWAADDSYPCVGQVAISEEGPATIQRARIVVKAETAGLLRTACIHEEFTQTLGLLNDYDGARPSIFNDDQEFATLTAHDELLLRILYDPRLKRGMSEREGMPIVRRIVDEIGPGWRS